MLAPLLLLAKLLLFDLFNGHNKFCSVFCLSFVIGFGCVLSVRPHLFMSWWEKTTGYVTGHLRAQFEG